MKLASVAILLAALLPFSAASQQANTPKAPKGAIPKEVRKAIESGYRLMNRAYEKNEPALLEKLYAPACKFKQKTEAPIIKAPQYIMATRGVLAAYHIEKSSTKVLKILPEKETYIATIVWSLVSWQKRDSATGSENAPNPAKVDQTISDTWEKTSQGWRIVKRLVEGG